MLHSFTLCGPAVTETVTHVREASSTSRLLQISHRVSIGTILPLTSINNDADRCRSAAPARCYLLELPAELRLVIYETLFPPFNLEAVCWMRRQVE